MKILYDYQTFTEQDYGGISRYFTQIIKLIKEKDNLSYNIASLFSNNYYLNKNRLNRKKFLPNLDFKGKRRLMKIVNQAYSRTLLKKQEFDIFHPTYYDTYFLDVLGKKPYVITVHDLIYEIYGNNTPTHAKIRKEMVKSITNANHIISISNNTKNDLINYYGIPGDNISVVYHGTPFEINNDEIVSNLKLPDKYFLFVGNRDGYKNFVNLVKAISSLLKKENIILVCAGGGQASKDELSLLDQLRISKNVIFIPRVKDEELIYLYKKALTFIFPSKYEGFGIPILEAMSCGCPVVLSNSSSFPEVAGDAALYFDPENLDSILHCVEKIIQSKILRDELINKGFERVKLFTWESAYLKTIEVYKKLI